MFDKIKGAFETCSQSSMMQKDVTLRPVTVKMGATRAEESVIEILKDLKYKEINYNDTFHEIFTFKAGYEVTISFLNADGSTIINVMVYNANKRGKTRKALRYLLNIINERLNNGQFI